MNRDDIVVELEHVLENLKKALKQCSRGLLTQREGSQVIRDADKKLEEVLPPDSTAFRIYDRLKRERTDYWKVTISGYIHPPDCKNFERWIDIVQNVVNEYQPEIPGSRYEKKEQYFISAGDEYGAQRLLLKIMKRAKKSLAIVDPYLDENIFDYVDTLNTSVDIQLVTAQTKPIFRNLYNSLKTTRLNIEAREYHRSHDRFLIIDGSELWHLGASINKFGEKDSMINKVIDAEEASKFFSAFEDYWSKGKKI